MRRFVTENSDICILISWYTATKTIQTIFEGVPLMKKLSIVLALVFMLGACDTQEANEMASDWNSECQSAISNRHLGNFACAFHTFGRIIEYPFTR